MKKPKASARGNELRKARGPGVSRASVYPFSGIVGQDEMKLGLILNVIDPSIGGVLMMGHRGTGKSTAVRALADLLPQIWIARGCRFNCEPANPKLVCADCAKQLAANNKLMRERCAVPVVDLPLGATEDRVCGAIDIQRALSEGVKAFEPGLLARANRGFLYIDEVNLLEDHLVDLLLDVAVTGRNKVERENISIEHPARFVLIGSGNPEEGELRPQLLDRFGLYIEVKTENDPDQRVEIMEKREAFERNPEKFGAAQENEQKELRKRIARASKNFIGVRFGRMLLRQIAILCSELKVDGHRGELTIMRAARALAAFEGRKSAREEDVRRVATMSLSHRLHGDVLSESAGKVQIERALDKVFSRSVDDLPNVRAETDHPGGDGNGSHSRPVKKGSNRPSDRDGRKATESEIELSAAATLDARVPPFSLDHYSTAGLVKNPRSPRRRAKAGAASYNSQRGRYARAISFRRRGARIALDATLRTLIGAGYRASDARKAGKFDMPTRKVSHSDPINRRPIPSDVLRFKQFASKRGILFIFAIDTSGSMALNRISRAKGALLNLLKESYINRDTVAVVAFRGTSAELLLPPTRSIVRARRVLNSLSVGGGTPLSAGLACSLGLAERAKGDSGGEIVLLLFTDGGANVPLHANERLDRHARQNLIENEVSRLGSKLNFANVQTVVVEAPNGFVTNEETRSLARILRAHHLTLSAWGATNPLNVGSPIPELPVAQPGRGGTARKSSSGNESRADPSLTEGLPPFSNLGKSA